MWQSSTVLLCCFLTASLTWADTVSSRTKATQVNVSDHIDGRIINGARVNPGTFPWQVSIIYDNNGEKVCGGCLINERWVVTAAHCVAGGNNFRVSLGSVRLNGADSNRVTRGWESSFWHPNYNAQTLANDIGLIKMNANVQFNQYIYPIRYSGNRDFLQPGTNVYVSGWGNTYENSGVTEYLMYTVLRVISNQECKAHFRPELVGDGVVCAKGDNKQSSCYGDSGGPVTRYDSDGRYTLVGLVSYSDNRGCSYGYPVGYTRLQYYNDFIYNHSGVRPGT